MSYDELTARLLREKEQQAAEITRLRAALREIAEGEVSDHPIELRAFCRAALEVKP